MNALIYFTLCLISLLTVPLKGQTITIDLPVSRMVFQRSLDNSALVPVRGRVLAQANRVKGRLVARQGGQTTEWREGTVQNGVYQITIPAVGGFYDLELITLAGNTELERQRRERIGVGEVFVVSGQSNNFGEPGLGLPATDDRVSVVNQRQSNANYFDEKALPMAFAQAGAGTNCGPVNPLYIWGGLGDRLVAKLGVPVLFLGAAHQGSSTQNWREAAQGVDRVGGRDWFNNVPYRPLRSTLHYYTSQTGVRGILWHQGESDNMYQTTDGYVDNMRILINKTREDSKFSNLSWMIARASYYPFYPGHERDPGI
ncbi:MAG: sialate O-acetylesterase, partial [Rudanella sp.]|nr:sialate O-acetylesterase [Rudanella sp.]